MLNSSSDETHDNALPFQLIDLEDGRTKALFTVPADLAMSLTAHPILCRGSSFSLLLHRVDDDSSLSDDKCILFTEYFSPVPEETAQDIYARLTIRMTHSDTFVIASMLGSILSG